MRGVARLYARAIVLLGCAAALGGCRRQEGGGPEITASDVEAELGLEGLARQGTWALLRLRLRNGGDDFSGELLVQGRSARGDDPVTYRREIEIPGRSSTWREVALPVEPAAGWEKVEISLRQPGFQRSFELETAGLKAPDAFCVLVVADRTPDFSWLLAQIQEGAARGLPKGLATRPLETRTVRPQQLWSQTLAYEPFQLVVLAGPDLTALSEGALAALAAWVERGGTLVAFPGPSWSGAAAGAELERLLGVRVGPPGEIVPDHLLARLDLTPGRWTHRPLELLGDTALTADGLASAARVGLGLSLTLRLAPADFGAGSFGETALLRTLAMPLARAFSFAGDSATGLREMEKHLVPALYLQCGRRLPSRAAICLGLGLYGLLGFLVPWRLLGRRGRRELAFAVMAGASVLAIGCIYGLGLFSGIEAAEVEEITVVRARPGEDRAQATSFLGVISPRPVRLDIAGEARAALQAGGERALWQPLRGEKLAYFQSGAPLPVPGTAISCDEDGRAAPDPLGLSPNAMRFLRCDFELRLGETLGIIARDAGGRDRLPLTLTNEGSAPASVYLLSATTYSRLGEIAPGGSFEVSPTPPADAPRAVPVDPLHRWRWDPFQDADASVFDWLLPILVRRVAEPSRTLPPGEPWGGGGSEDSEEARLPLRNPWFPEDPRFVIALVRRPAFPALASVSTRHAIAAVVIEISPHQGTSQ